MKKRLAVRICIISLLALFIFNILFILLPNVAQHDQGSQGMRENVDKQRIPSSTSRGSTGDGGVCVVVRTCEQQVWDRIYPLSELLDFLVLQHQKGRIQLEVLLVPTDNDIPLGIRRIYESYQKELNMSLLEFNNRPPYLLPGHFGIFRERHNPHFHDIVYDLTDKAISKCSEEKSWLLVTNGDNTYDPTFFEHLDDSVDLLAFDFYSRHTREFEGLEFCQRLVGASPKEHTCMSNNLSWAGTDLGANIINLVKFREEKRLYSAVNAPQSHRGASKDAFMVMELVNAGWRVGKVKMSADHGCLFSHNPNYFSCIQRDPLYVWNEKKGSCVFDVEGETRNTDGMDGGRSDVRSIIEMVGTSLNYKYSAFNDSVNGFLERCIR